MVNLTIDDKQVAVAKDATIFDAAKAAGIRIPILCHDKKLYPFGGCRMCLVEVEQMKGRLIPACTTPVTEGMIVRTVTDEIIKARKMVLELLLLKHPVDCPVCDAAGDCDLQNLTYEYQVNGNHYVDEKFHHEIDYENPLIERDMNRCIHCGKCARICDEIVSFGAYTFISRGIEAKMGTAFDGPLNCEFCGSCISVCPVGALLSRPFKFKARWWALNKVKTVCSYCGTGCQLTLGVKDDQVQTTVYDENQGFHNGQLCTRGRFGYQVANHEERLTTPLVRKDGELKPATWEEALGVVAARLQEAKSAPESVAALATPRLTNEELFLFRKLFTEAVGTGNIDHSGGYAHAALTQGAAESIGYAGSPSTIQDVQKSSLLLVVKTDAYETHPVIGFEINLGVKRQGVDLRILSDKKGKLSRLPKAQTYVHKPGQEVAVLNALARIILDENLADASAASLPGIEELKKSLASLDVAAVAAAAGVTVENLSALARDYANAEKALILVPLGMGYPSHGKSLAQAVLNLALLTGNIGKEGGGVLFMGEKNNSQGAVDMGIVPAGKGASAIVDGCADGSIRLLYVAGENPVVSYPDRKRVEAALDKVDFLVVNDLFLTETALKADVVLPVTSSAEKDGTFTSVERRVQRVRKAIRPVGTARSDFEVFNFLYAALAGAPAFADVSEAFGAISQQVPGYAQISFAALSDDGAFWNREGSPRLVAVDAKAGAAEAGKLALVTGSALYHCGTMSRYGKGPLLVCPEGYVELNSQDAQAQKIENDETVTVKSSAGEIRLKAKVGTRLPQGVAFAPYHFGENSVNTVSVGAPVTWITISK